LPREIARRIKNQSVGRQAQPAESAPRKLLSKKARHEAGQWGFEIEDYETGSAKLSNAFKVATT
jgi:hypothetical protein